MDVDGYLFETLTQPKELWEADLARDLAKSHEISQRNNELYPKVKATYVGLAEVVHLFPNFYEDVMQLKKNIEARRGHPFQFEVIDFGSDLYWADIGQLQKARKAMHEVQEETDSGVIARALAGINHMEKDRFGNRIVGPDTFLHTSIPKDPLDLSKGLQDWWAPADGKYNPGDGTNYYNVAQFALKERTLQNPLSFQEKFIEMRQRTVQPSLIEEEIETLFREPIRKKLTAEVHLFKKG